MKSKFIKTKDRETFEKLKKDGFQLIESSDGVWTFINDEKRLMTFDKNKVVYSNILNF